VAGGDLGARLRHRVFGALLGGLGLALALADVAAAQSCFDMQAEMMQLRSRIGRGGAGDTARYESAYREQLDVIRRTEDRARQGGCFGSGFFLFRRSPDRSCSTLVPKLQEMQDNLARLDHLRRQGAGGADAYRMRELEGMMNVRGCDLPTGNLYEARPNDNWFFNQNPNYGGTYRTLCVRTCDGYYFPISFSTTPEQFPQDAQTCETMCPGAEAKLYYHPNPGGGPEDMVAITGEPYSTLPTAFQYRTSFDASCTCKPPGGLQVAAAQSTPPPGVTIDLSAPLPRPRPAPGEDPETLADRAGAFVPRIIPEEANAGDQMAADAAGRPIRIVGPPIGNAAQDALVISTVPN